MKRSTNNKAANKTVSKKAVAPKVVALARKSSVNFEVIQEYTDFMKTNDLVEIDFQGKDFSIRLRRFEGVPASAPTYSAPVASAPAAPAKASAPAVAAANLHLVKSPFVGTFYRCPGPNQGPFAEEGKVVSSGDTLCIIEAMKLMNEIESDIKGRVVRVLIKDGTPVEFGEALFEIEPV